MMWLYLVALVTLASDLATKHIATVELLGRPGQRVPVIPNLLDFYWQANTGGAFSLLREHPMIITAFSAVAIVAIVIWAHRLPRAVISAHVAFGLLIGGAIGNLIDRVRLGYVVDFIHVYWGRWAFPTFNVADSAITVGITVFLILSLFTKKLDPAPKSAETAPADEQIRTEDVPPGTAKKF
jgi:signal peptidase II